VLALADRASSSPVELAMRSMLVAIVMVQGTKSPSDHTRSSEKGNGVTTSRFLLTGKCMLDVKVWGESAIIASIITRNPPDWPFEAN
jgi:hypothetical protein